ncbi:MAG: hypothetical protein OEV43_05835 [Coriobacteriia bacterium]|nr:hypothetical protein [Coriobacteriia bacterium]
MSADSRAMTPQVSGEKNRVFALPRTRIAWTAILLSAFALGWGLLSPDVVRIPIPGSGFFLSGIAAIAALTTGIVAITKHGERSLLLWVVVTTSGLYSVLAVAFLALELFVGHD